jgi:hypothetical protein
MPTPTVDLTVSGNSGTVGSGVFMTGELQPAGTGAFNSFVQIQNIGTEQGYNSDHSPQFNEVSSLQHNHSTLLADIPIVIGRAEPIGRAGHLLPTSVRGS